MLFYQAIIKDLKPYLFLSMFYWVNRSLKLQQFLSFLITINWIISNVQINLTNKY
jgi:hypothetical protein